MNHDATKARNNARLLQLTWPELLKCLWLRVVLLTCQAERHRALVEAENARVMCRTVSDNAFSQIMEILYPLPTQQD